MKKFVALALAALLVVGVVGTVFAADTTFEGAYRVRA